MFVLRLIISWKREKEVYRRIDPRRKKKKETRFFFFSNDYTQKNKTQRSARLVLFSSFLLSSTVCVFGGFPVFGILHSPYSLLVGFDSRSV